MHTPFTEQVPLVCTNHAVASGGGEGGGGEGGGGSDGGDGGGGGDGAVSEPHTSQPASGWPLPAAQLMVVPAAISWPCGPTLPW